MPSWHCAAGSACLRPGRSSSWPDGPPRRGFPGDLRRVNWSWLPAGLRDAGQLTPVRHGAEADPAQAEPAVDGAGTPAPGAPGVGAHLELGLALGLGDETL